MYRLLSRDERVLVLESFPRHQLSRFVLFAATLARISAQWNASTSPHHGHAAEEVVTEVLLDLVDGKPPVWVPHHRSVRVDIKMRDLIYRRISEYYLDELRGAG